MSNKQSNDNLAIWDQVKQTDPDATKQYKGAGGFSGTSINSTYQVRKATELFGPVGIGWGWEIVSERIDEGHPIAGKDSEGKAIIHDNVTTKVHTLHLRLWYMLDGKRGEVDHFGHTPFVYTNKHGVQMEAEPSKKSLTDAIGKALSMLGFSADIFMGEFDDQNYLEQVRVESSIKKAEDKEAEIISRREELTEYVKRHLDLIETASTENETSKIGKSALRHLARQSQIASLKTVAESGTRAITEATEKRLEQLKEEKQDETV
jgi:hypothetical protein